MRARADSTASRYQPPPLLCCYHAHPLCHTDYAFGYGWQLLDPCAAKVLPKFMNNREVQLALGAIQPSEETRQWKACNGQGIKYSIKDLTTSMVPVYKELVSRGEWLIDVKGVQLTAHEISALAD